MYLIIISVKLTACTCSILFYDICLCVCNILHPIELFLDFQVFRYYILYRLYSGFISVSFSHEQYFYSTHKSLLLTTKVNQHLHCVTRPYMYVISRQNSYVPPHAIFPELFSLIAIISYYTCTWYWDPADIFGEGNFPLRLEHIGGFMFVFSSPALDPLKGRITIDLSYRAADTRIQIWWTDQKFHVTIFVSWTKIWNGGFKQMYY